jgi:hypothetical protein
MRLAHRRGLGRDILRVALAAGKATWPECVDSPAERTVSNTVGCSRMTMGTSTAASEGCLAVMRFSCMASGSHCGGWAKRVRRPAASAHPAARPAAGYRCPAGAPGADQQCPTRGAKNYQLQACRCSAKTKSKNHKAKAGIKKPPQRTVAAFTESLPIRVLHGCSSSLVNALGQLFLDTSRLAAALTQVVQLGTTHITATLDFDLGDQGE